ncbi:MAG: Asp-tRNA(Asn)/Glu-tRNA(Gln) amidotransferase subunit GatB, partial [Thermodesulfovibrio sp.]
RKIRIKRIHLEEDAGKNIHDPSGYSFVDFNRTGVPLMEIVSEPDIRSPKEAALYMKKLRAILRYLGVCDGNLEQGSLRCDANVSVRPSGSSEFGVKTEIKNINSFKFVEKALEYEIKRQIKLLSMGEKIIQETRLWDAQTGTTQSMRSKEEAHDYRYFPEPDLVPLIVSEEWIEAIKKQMPELPDQKFERFVKEYGLPQYDAEILTEEKALAEWFEEAVNSGGNPKEVANWIMVELLRLLNEDGKDITECSLTPSKLVELLALIEKGIINRNTAKDVFEEIYKTGKSAETIVKEKGLTQISDSSVIIETIREVMAKNPKEVERFRAGEEKLIGFFVGQVMKLTKGKANPKLVNELILKILKEE